MDWSGWAIFGLVATVLLTAIIVGAQLAGFTRLDIPLMLGTLVTGDPDRARFFGFFLHLAMGQLFALFYAAGTIGTIEAVRRKLGAGGPLLYRYRDHDGLGGNEGAFLPCSFWLVHALAETGQRGEAETLFEELLNLSSSLGLYSEEMDPGSHEHLGNHPQALTHSALLQAASALEY